MVTVNWQQRRHELMQASVGGQTGQPLLEMTYVLCQIMADIGEELSSIRAAVVGYGVGEKEFPGIKDYLREIEAHTRQWDQPRR